MSTPSFNSPANTCWECAKLADDYTITAIADSLNHRWSLACLPDGRLLVTERSGQLRVIDKGEVSSPLAGVHTVFAKSQGGLFDVVLHPDYETNG